MNDLENGLSQKTNEAVADGKVSTAGYVQQARDMAGSALATAAVSLVSLATYHSYLLNFFGYTVLPAVVHHRLKRQRR